MVSMTTRIDMTLRPIDVHHQYNNGPFLICGFTFFFAVFTFEQSYGGRKVIKQTNSPFFCCNILRHECYKRDIHSQGNEIHSVMRFSVFWKKMFTYFIYLLIHMYLSSLFNPLPDDKFQTFPN